MKKPHVIFALFIILCLFLSGCNDNDNEIGVLELKPIANSNSDSDSQTQAIKANWQTTNHEKVSDMSDLTMYVKEGSESSLGLTLAFENKSNAQVIFGERYILEVSIDDTWYELPALTSDYRWSDVEYELSGPGGRRLEINWKHLYGDLKKGHYRIIKEVMVSRGFASLNKECMAAEFTLD